jgi:hypothetical protein
LRAKYAEVFGETTNGRHMEWIIKRIGWRMQANAEGGLTERARRRAAELANDADLRVTPPRELNGASTGVGAAADRVALNGDDRLPAPGTVITREYKGGTVEAKVLREGFEFEGEVYQSLSAVAKAATGSHWNGYHFFGLSKKGAGR